MSFCTYVASDIPLLQSACLWPLSRGGEDIYTEKVYTSQIVPNLDDLSGELSYMQNHLKTAGEPEIWHIWQGVETEPVIRSQTVPAGELAAEHPKVEPRERAVNALVRKVKSRHVRRLRDGLCSVEYGSVLEDLLIACECTAVYKSRGLRTKTL